MSLANVPRRPLSLEIPLATSFSETKLPVTKPANLVARRMSWSFALALIASFAIHSMLPWNLRSSLIAIIPAFMSAWFFVFEVYEHYVARHGFAAKVAKPMPPIVSVLLSLLMFGKVFYALAEGTEKLNTDRLPNLSFWGNFALTILAATLFAVVALPRWLAIPTHIRTQAAMHLSRALQAWLDADDDGSIESTPASPVGSRAFRLFCFDRTVFMFTLSVASLTCYAPIVPANFSESTWQELIYSHPVWTSPGVVKEPLEPTLVRENLSRFSLEELESWRHVGPAPRGYETTVRNVAKRQLNAVNKTPTGWLVASRDFAKSHFPLAVLAWLTSLLVLAFCVFGPLAACCIGTSFTSAFVTRFFAPDPPRLREHTNAKPTRESWPAPAFGRAYRP